MHDAQQSADRQGGAQVQPRLDLLPSPAVHADLATLAALAASHEDRAGAAVKVAFGEGERLADAQAGAPQDHDQRPQAQPVRGVAGAAHDRNDLLDRRRIGGIMAALVARRAAAVVTGHRGRRTATAGGVEQHRSRHDERLLSRDRCAWKAVALSASLRS
jgi:hypothetical protein